MRASIAIAVLVAAGLAWAMYSQFAGPRGTDEGPVLQTGKTSAAKSGEIPAATIDLELPSPIRFSDSTAASGIDFRHHAGTSPEKPFPAANGSGIAALDYDLDGAYDLYFATGTQFPIDMSRSEPRNRMYRNAGEWRFEDVTGPSGLGHNGFSAGIAVGDYDADGFPDVYVTCYGANRLYQNQGDGTFRPVGEEAGVADPRWGTSAAFFDADADGLLDLYVCNYAQWTLETNRFCGDRTRNVRLYCDPRSVPPKKDVFYRNQGDGRFEDATDDAGLGAVAGRGQGVLAADFNGDRRIDLYVANDLHPNFLYLNEGGGRFRDATDASGAGYDHSGKSQAGMGVDASDMNCDGRIDLFVTNYEGEHNALYENLGQAIFHDASDRYGLAAGSLPWVGWGTMFADFDLDGWDDLIVTNGHTDDNFHELGRDSVYEQPPLVYHNEQGRFAQFRDGVGTYFKESHVGRALALADLDSDGDHDVVIGHQDAAPALLRNERLSAMRGEERSIRLRLIGTRSNRDAVGSVIILSTSERQTIQQVKGGGSYLSAHDLRQILAVGPAETDLQIEIQWPAGGRTQVSGVRRGGSYTVIEPVGQSDHRLLSTPFSTE